MTCKCSNIAIIAALAGFLVPEITKALEDVKVSIGACCLAVSKLRRSQNLKFKALSLFYTPGITSVRTGSQVLMSDFQTILEESKEDGREFKNQEDMKSATKLNTLPSLKRITMRLRDKMARLEKNLSRGMMVILAVVLPSFL